MACIKCGRDVTDGQVFCENCLEIMEYYPVKPGTAVQLPKRTAASPRKAPKRRGPSLEEQVKILKTRVRLLAISLVVALMIAGLLAIPAYEHLFIQHFRPGQNYSTVTHNSTTSPVTTGN